MRTFRCSCENMLFFDNTVCLRCNSATGFCPACRGIVALQPQPAGDWQCGNPACGASLVKCHNYQKYDVCNRCVKKVDAPPKAATSEPVAEDPVTSPEPVFCDCCSFNQTIPDLTVPGHLEKWYRLEGAKRRLFYDLDLVGLPYRFDEADPRPKLRFDFKADYVGKRSFWRPMGKKERVFTGHADGCITINISEADAAERERLRVTLGEAHRTLIGHFRHEIAHYYWQILIQGQDEEKSFREMFGDHENPTYQEAMQNYYKNGPAPDWQARHVSAYASMHPWEDFAEIFATYLDMTSVLDTSYHVEFIRVAPRFGDFDSMVRQYKALGIGMNEINRSMGLIDLLPEVLTEIAREKMRFVHQLISKASESAAPSTAASN